MAKYTLTEGAVLHSPERDYHVVRVLGQGGFGITYLVDGDVTIGNITARIRFAIKEHFISQLCDRDADSQHVTYSKPVAETVHRSLQAFIKEANRLHTLGIKHPNIVKINEVLEANNTAYYVMEYLEGETLGQYVARQGSLSEAETEYFMRPLIEAAADLHRTRLTHYDIKPDNIILSRGSDNIVRATLIDFGLAKHYDRDGNATSTIATSGYSPGYAPMEQYAGLKEFSPQSDVYSLAATIYFCLTGHRPAEAFAIRPDDIYDDLSQVASPQLAKAVSHAMQLQRCDRQADAAVLLDEIYGQNHNHTTQPTSGTTEKPKPVANEPQSIPTVVKQYDALPDDMPADMSDNNNKPKTSKRKTIAIAAVSVLVAATLITTIIQTLPSGQADTMATAANVDTAIITIDSVTPAITDSIKTRTPETIPTKSILPSADITRDKTPSKNDKAKSVSAEIDNHSDPAPNANTNNPEKIYLYSEVENKPFFPGGEGKMHAWINSNMIYPQSAISDNVQGTVLVEFVISETGTITDVTIRRGKHPALDREAIRLVKSLPRWEPGSMDGKHIKVKNTIPIKFHFK